MSWKLLELVHVDQLPEFQYMWPTRHAQALKDYIDYLVQPGPEKKFVVSLGGASIGVTGYWPCLGDIGIAWTGLYPAYRRQGWGRDIINQAISLAQADPNYSLCTRAVQMLPDDRPELRLFFSRLGFTPTFEDDYTVPDQSTMWTKYVRWL